MEEDLQPLRWPDYLIFISCLAVSLGIGLYHGCKRKKQDTIAHYILGNRKLKWIPVSASMLVSLFSPVVYTGVPAEIYTWGTAYFLAHIGKAISQLFGALVVVPLFFPLKLTSTFEYLELRFQSNLVKIEAVILGIFGELLGLGGGVFAFSTSVEIVADIPLWITILVTCVVTAAYTALGGMPGVIWTDVFQFLVMFAGFLLIMTQGIIVCGGVKSVWQSNLEGGRLDWSSFDPDPRIRHTVWGLLIGGTFSWLGVGFSQEYVQRLSAVPTQAAATKSMLLVALGVFVWAIIASTLGMVAYAYYHIKRCDPLYNKQVQNGNQITSLLVVEIFQDHPGAVGVYLASLLSGCLSSLSSGLNGLAAITWQNLLKWKLGHIKEENVTKLMKVMVTVYALIVIGTSFLIAQLRGTLTRIILTSAGVVGGPLVGLFLLGAFFPCANWKGAAVATPVSLAICLWLAIGSFTMPARTPLPPAPSDQCSVNNVTTLVINVTTLVPPVLETSTPWITVTEEAFTEASSSSALDDLYALSYIWYAVLAVIIMLVVGLTVSLVTGRSRDVDPRLLVSFPSCFCCVGRKRNQFDLETEKQHTSQTQSGHVNHTYQKDDVVLKAVEYVSRDQTKVKGGMVKNSKPSHLSTNMSERPMTQL